MAIVKPGPGTLVNKLSSLANGLMLAWLLNENTGTVANDSSGNGLNGTLQGSPLPTWAAGVYGPAVAFGAQANGSVVALASGLPTSLPLTILVSVTPTTLGTNNFFAATGSSNTAIVYQSQLNIADGASLALSGSIANGVQSLLAGLFNGASSAGFDGSTKTSGNTGTNAPPGTFFLGNSAASGGGTCANAVIDFVYVWNRILTDDEVNTLFGNPFAMYAAMTQGGYNPPGGTMSYDEDPQNEWISSLRAPDLKGDNWATLGRRIVAPWGLQAEFDGLLLHNRAQGASMEHSCKRALRDLQLEYDLEFDADAPPNIRTLDADVPTNIRTPRFKDEDDFIPFTDQMTEEG